MKHLSVAQMQTVEIAKALAHQAELIIMDEPTSAISEREVEALFDRIRDVRRRGVAVIYISHKLDEIFRIADAVTVLRDGRHVATHDIGEVNEQRLIAWMVGRELQAVFPKSSAEPGAVALEVRGLTRPGEFRDVSFQVRRGEIVGIAGLMGAAARNWSTPCSAWRPPDPARSWCRAGPSASPVPGRRWPRASPWSAKTASGWDWSRTCP